MVANTTGDDANVLLMMDWKLSRLMLMFSAPWMLCVIWFKQPSLKDTPIPMAMDNPATVVFLNVSFSVVSSLIPVMAMDANTEATAPPSTHYGIVRSSAENFGIRPAMSRNVADKVNTRLATTFVEPTIPTFWL